MKPHTVKHDGKWYAVMGFRPLGCPLWPMLASYSAAANWCRKQNIREGI